MRVLSLRVYLIALMILAATILGHWRLTPTWDILFYVLGAVIGLHLIELLEGFLFTGFVASPLKTSFVYLLIVVLTLFVVTSTRNLIGSGVVLFLHLRYMLLIKDDFLKGNFGRWFNGGMLEQSRANWWVWGALAVQGAGMILFAIL